MTRSKGRSPKINKTTAHFDRIPPNEIEFVKPPVDNLPPGRGWNHRLSWTPPCDAPFASENLRELLQKPPNDEVVWFLDANMFLHPMDDRIWELLLSRENRIAIAQPWFGDIKKWIEEPRGINLLAHSAFEDYRRNPTCSPIQLISIPDENSPTRIALNYY